MIRRPFFWGIIGFFFSLSGWLVLVIMSGVTLGEFRFFANAFGYMGLASIALGLAGELIRYVLLRKSR